MKLRKPRSCISQNAPVEGEGAAHHTLVPPLIPGPVDLSSCTHCWHVPSSIVFFFPHAACRILVP